MFVMPTLVTMTIAATRMYRSLSDFGSNADVRGGAHHFSFLLFFSMLIVIGVDSSKSSENF
jgi:hypothetical protein